MDPIKNPRSKRKTTIENYHQAINHHLINKTSTTRVNDLICIKQEVKKVCRKDQLCLVFRHDDWPNHELHCVKKWATVHAEGDQSSFFDNTDHQEKQIENQKYCDDVSREKLIQTTVQVYF